ncbi:MAG: endonuclease MutS2 [Candidatus Cloacimonadota bacterium]|nr:MAG: endonuclease MutS2 [Candidatus Cloacimonadota bacterium]
MHFTSEILLLLEFDRLRKVISNFSFSILGREAILSIVPQKEKSEETVSLVKEFRLLLNSTRIFPVPQDKDIRPILKKVKEGVEYLSIKELFHTGEVTRDYKKVGFFLGKLPSEYKNIAKLGFFSKKLPDLYEKIQKIIDENGEIKDNASAELKSIRSGFRRSHKKLLSAANNLISEKKRFLQEEIFTTKEGRIVLPVLFSKKKNVRGIVHSISQTQNTIFIEPVELVELNNECATFKLREEEEIKRLLRTLTKEIQNNIDCYEKSIEEMREIDKLYAIASFSEKYNLTPPLFSKEPYLVIRKGKHPLLLIKKGKDGVVPFDIELGRKSKILLISGPNMGGKTVLLKSIGIITLMAYAGMHIPAKEDSMIPDIDAIYADIGDKQSIEMDLSTFSSHIKNITAALKNVTKRSLVLLDEIGVGTDPEEGMGIAMATLEKLAEKGALTFATTHYGKLKHFVAERKTMVNASMDFNIKKGIPTYHLSLGIPGISHGFAVAEKMGFPAELLSKAKSYIDKNVLRTDELLCSLGELMKKVENEKKIIDEERKKLDSLLAEYDMKYREIRAREKEFLKDAKHRAEGIVYSTRREMENLVKEIRESQASKEDIKKAKEKISKKLQHFKKEAEIKKEKGFSLGDYVYSNQLKISGKIIEILEGYARVEGEKFRFLTPFEALELKRDKGKKEEKDMVFIDKKDVNFEIDIRGLLAEEAEIRVTRFIDDTFLSGLSTIYIIHGKGSGALRETVSEILKKDKRIEEFRLGYWNEGGSGVTIAKLKI